jgi:hypothetical protein
VTETIAVGSTCELDRGQRTSHVPGHPSQSTHVCLSGSWLSSRCNQLRDLRRTLHVSCDRILRRAVRRIFPWEHRDGERGTPGGPTHRTNRSPASSLCSSAVPLERGTEGQVLPLGGTGESASQGGQRQTFTVNANPTLSVCPQRQRGIRGRCCAVITDGDPPASSLCSSAVPLERQPRLQASPAEARRYRSGVSGPEQVEVRRLSRGVGRAVDALRGPSTRSARIPLDA